MAAQHPGRSVAFHPVTHQSSGGFHKIKCLEPAPEMLCLSFLPCPNRARVGILEVGGSI